MKLNVEQFEENDLIYNHNTCQMSKLHFQFCRMNVLKKCMNEYRNKIIL